MAPRRQLVSTTLGLDDPLLADLSRLAYMRSTGSSTLPAQLKTGRGVKNPLEHYFNVQSDEKEL